MAAEPERFDLTLRGLKRPAESITVKVYLAEAVDPHPAPPVVGDDSGSDGSGGDPDDDDPTYAGSIYVYGHGQTEELGDTGPDDRRARQRTPYDAGIEVSEQLARVEGARDLAVRLVPVDFHGRALSDDVLDFDELALEPRSS